MSKQLQGIGKNQPMAVSGADMEEWRRSRNQLRNQSRNQIKMEKPDHVKVVARN